MTLAGLTPSQELMVDLLVARTRLGEPFWPISTQLYRTYRVLSDKGYVSILHGHVEGTVRLMLTEQAKNELIGDSTYTSPLEKQVAQNIKKVLEKLGGDPTTIRMIDSTIYGSKRWR